MRVQSAATSHPLHGIAPTAHDELSGFPYSPCWLINPSLMLACGLHEPRCIPAVPQPMHSAVERVMSALCGVFSNRLVDRLPPTDAQISAPSCLLHACVPAHLLRIEIFTQGCTE